MFSRNIEDQDREVKAYKPRVALTDRIHQVFETTLAIKKNANKGQLTPSRWWPAVLRHDC